MVQENALSATAAAAAGASAGAQEAQEHPSPAVMANHPSSGDGETSPPEASSSQDTAVAILAQPSPAEGDPSQRLPDSTEAMATSSHQQQMQPSLQADQQQPCADRPGTSSAGGPVDDGDDLATLYADGSSAHASSSQQRHRGHQVTPGQGRVLCYGLCVQGHTPGLCTVAD